MVTLVPKRSQRGPISGLNVDLRTLVTKLIFTILLRRRRGQSKSWGFGMTDMVFLLRREGIAGFAQHPSTLP